MYTYEYSIFPVKKISKNYWHTFLKVQCIFSFHSTVFDTDLGLCSFLESLYLLESAAEEHSLDSFWKKNTWKHVAKCDSTFFFGISAKPLIVFNKGKCGAIECCVPLSSVFVRTFAEGYGKN